MKTLENSNSEGAPQGIVMSADKNDDKKKDEAKYSPSHIEVKGRNSEVDMPEELEKIQAEEAAARKDQPKKKPKRMPGEPRAKTLTGEELKKFIRGEVTLAQLEGISREQLYDFAELGYTMFKSGKLEDASKIFEGLVTYNPYDAYFHSALGAIYQKQKRYDDSIRQYDLAIKFNPQDTCSFANRGETFLMLGRLQEAAQDFQKAIELDPDEKDPWAMRARALVLAVTNALKGQE